MKRNLEEYYLVGSLSSYLHDLKEGIFKVGHLKVFDNKDGLIFRTFLFTIAT